MNLDLNKIWEEFLTVISSEPTITNITFNTWFKPSKPLKIKDDKFYILVENDIAKDTLTNYFTDLIKNGLKEVSLKDLEPIILTPNDKGNNLVVDYNETNNQNSKTGFNSPNLNDKYIFEEFVVGNSNKLAHAASLAVAESPSKAYNPLFIYGGVGLGKTHLMHAIGHHVLNKNKEANVVYVSSEKFTNELINSIKDDKNIEFRNKYRNVDILLVDDIQFIAGKDRTQEEFFHTFNTLYENSKQIILSSDRPPKEIPTLEDRLRSRFESGLIADIQAPDYETRVAILRKKAEKENITVTDDVLQFIAKKIKSNIRELEGSLTRIVAYSSLDNSEINISLAEEALKDIISSSKPKKVDIPAIKDAVSQFYNIKSEDFNSKRRTRSIAYPRQIAMYLARTMTDLSLPKIGEEFGGRDHTTVIHAHDKILSDIEKDNNFAEKIENIKKEILGE